jgi:hypothetical protein
MRTGKLVGGIESIINSHTLDEAQMFAMSMAAEKDFDAILKHFWGNSQPAVDSIKKTYPVAKYNSQNGRLKAFILHSTFTCSNRYISEAYKNKTYNLQYSRGTGTHGSDLMANFYSPSGGFKSISLGSSRSDPAFGNMAASFQSYLVSHAMTGDPNKLRDKNTISWPLAALGPTITNVLNVTDSGFKLIGDDTTKAEDCDAWKNILVEMTKSLELL